MERDNPVKNFLFALLFLIFLTNISNASNININDSINIKKGDVINYKDGKWLVMQVDQNGQTVLCPYYDYNRFFNSSDWGWFYNQKCIQISIKSLMPKKPSESQPQQQVRNKPQTIEQMPDSEVIALATNPHFLNKLSAKEFKKMYDRVTDISVMQPTEKNVAAYMYMTNFTRVKALIFSHAVVDYTMAHPQYNMIKKLGETSWSYIGYNETQQKKQKELIDQHKDSLGLFVFIKNGCPYCEKQLPVLNWFQTDYKIDVLAVSKDSCPANTNNIQCVVNPVAFQAYNIQYEPTMVLVIKQANGTPYFEPVGVGLTDETTLFNRVYAAVKNYYYPNEKYDNKNLYKLLKEGE